jgi:WXG100 family type VII secretion target
MGQLETDLNVMSQVSTTFRTNYEQLAATVQTLRGDVVAALGGWKGLAPDAFNNVFGDVDTAWGKVNVALDNIAGHIHFAGTSYGNTDGDIATSMPKGVQVTGITSSLVPLSTQ